MSYNISSDKFTHPLLKPILTELTHYFKETGISFFVIGATARDIIMELHNEKSGRLTYDLDIAITINDWSQWAMVEAGILRLENFTKDEHQQQRFLYKNNFSLDIVPFGNISNQNYKIFWPPDENFAMSVLGFSAAETATLSVVIDKEIEIKIVNLCGIFLLKLVAWKDRHLESNKDADDIGFILNNYLEIYRDSSLEHYEEVYPENHTTLMGSATLLGIHLAEMLDKQPDVKKLIAEILSLELDKKEESRLMNQVLETHNSVYFEDIYKCIKNILRQLNK
jgi:predicted nucleotidyltransferase